MWSDIDLYRPEVKTFQYYRYKELADKEQGTDNRAKTIR